MTFAPRNPRRIRVPRIAAVTMTGLLLAIAPSAAAQTRSVPPTTGPDTGQWSVTPSIGTAFSGDVDSPTVALGVAAGYRWSPRVTVEGEFSLLPSSEANGLVEVDTTIWNVTGNVLYHFAEQPWRPYGAIGIGVGHGSADIKTSDPLLNLASSSSTEFVLNFGGGVERTIRDGMRFRGDLRYFFGGDLVADYWRLGLGVSFDLARGR